MSVSNEDRAFNIPTGSEERGILEVWSIPVAILPSCQYIRKSMHYMPNGVNMNAVGYNK